MMARPKLIVLDEPVAGVNPTLIRGIDAVIRALNADKPYDQFVAEQLAGDVVAAGTADEAATGFLVAGV